MVGSCRSFGPVGVVHKTSSCDRAERGSLSGCGVLPRSQFRGETLPMEGTRRRRGEGDVRCELSIEEEPSMVSRCIAAPVTLGEQLWGACQAAQRWSSAAAQLLERVYRRCLLTAVRA